MSINTVQRMFSNNDNVINSKNIIDSAKEHNNSNLFAIKDFILKIFTLGFYNATSERNWSREMEASNIAIDILHGLPEFSDINKLTDSKLLHHNQDKGYDIIFENSVVFLCDLTRNDDYRVELLNIKSKNSYNCLIKSLNGVRDTHEFRDMIENNVSRINEFSFNSLNVINSYREIAFEFGFDFCEKPESAKVNGVDNIKKILLKSEFGSDEYHELIKFFVDNNEGFKQDICALNIDKYHIVESMIKHVENKMNDTGSVNKVEELLEWSKNLAYLYNSLRPVQ